MNRFLFLFHLLFLLVLIQTVLSHVDVAYEKENASWANLAITKDDEDTKVLLHKSFNIPDFIIHISTKKYFALYKNCLFSPNSPQLSSLQHYKNKNLILIHFQKQKQLGTFSTLKNSSNRKYLI
ncbi:hypothetical protein SAMN05421797_10415 [Maribacter ulvicola]|uniref:Uncharacterized protein n=1 Tax=Maribacter ulvicola TaxID=228959 RepID=A0A1N6WA42_9FLAO|nr:hypothetical protein SAMN05421797_10415 [Maribacter ulvicola]